MSKRANRGPRPNVPATPPTEKRADDEKPKITTSTSPRLGSAQAAKDRQEKRKQEERRTQQMYIIGGIVAVAIVLGLLFFSANQPADAPIPTDDIARYSDIPVNWKTQNDEGFPMLGDPQAPVKLVEFASFGCPGCAQLHREVYPTLLERIKKGEISFTYVPLLTGEGNVTGAARVALCADKQGKFWDMHDTLFSWQNLYGTNAFNQNRLTSGVRALSLDEGAINGCVNSDPVNALIAKASGKGVDTTPTVRINNTPVQANDLATITAAIDAALANAPKPRSTPAVTAPVSATAEATAEATSAATTEAEATSAATQDATAEATSAN